MPAALFSSPVALREIRDHISNTRAELRYDLASSDAFPESIRRHMLDRLGGRAVGGVGRRPSCSESNSQKNV